MFCANCGQPISEEAKFCPNCGAANSAAVSQPAGEVPQPSTAPAAPAAEPAASQPQPIPTPQPAFTQAPYSAPAPAAPTNSDLTAAPAPAAVQTPYAPQPAYAAPVPYAAPKKTKTGLIVGICAGGAVVLAGIVVLILWLTGVFGGGLGGNSPQGVANSYISAIMDPNGMNGQKIVDLLPDQLVQYALENGNYGSEAELVEDLELTLGGTMSEALGYLDEVGAEYQFTVGQAAPITGSSLQDIQENYEYYGISVSEAQQVEATFTYSLLGEQGSESMQVPVIKIGGNWYLDLYSMS